MTQECVLLWLIWSQESDSESLKVKLPIVWNKTQLHLVAEIICSSSSFSGSINNISSKFGNSLDTTITITTASPFILYWGVQLVQLYCIDSILLHLTMSPIIYIVWERQFNQVRKGLLILLK